MRTLGNQKYTQNGNKNCRRQFYPPYIRMTSFIARKTLLSFLMPHFGQCRRSMMQTGKTRKDRVFDVMEKYISTNGLI